MKVDFELIRKYHLGLCSRAENETVEQWLHSEKTDIVPGKVLHPEFVKDKVMDKIRNRIASKERKKQKVLYLLVTHAAASVMLFAFLYTAHINRKVAQPTLSSFSNSKTIMLSKDIEFIAQSDRTLTFFKCGESVSNPCSATIQAKKGETYWISNVSIRGKEKIMIINKKDLKDLPVEIRSEMTRNFNG